MSCIDEVLDVARKVVEAKEVGQEVDIARVLGHLRPKGCRCDTSESAIVQILKVRTYILASGSESRPR
jgi:hypothetical protein